MKEKKKFKVLLLYFVVLISVILGYLSINSVYERYKLIREISLLSELDIAKDNFNTKLVTHGNYLKVERAVKNYLNDYSSNLQNINNLIDGEKFKNIFSYDSLKSTNNFESKIEDIKIIKEKFNFYVNNLFIICDEKNIRIYINKYTSNIYYKNLYYDLMFDEIILSKFNLKNELENYSESFNLKFDNCLGLIEFLNSNSEYWIVEDNEIKFATDDLKNTYEEYINKIK